MVTVVLLLTKGENCYFYKFFEGKEGLQPTQLWETCFARLELSAKELNRLFLKSSQFEFFPYSYSIVFISQQR